MQRILSPNRYSSHSLPRKLFANSESSWLKRDKGTSEVKPFNEIPRKHGLIQVCSAAQLVFPGRISRSLLKYFENKYPIYDTSLYRNKINLNFETVIVENPEDAETVLRTESKYPIRLTNEPFAAFREKNKKPAGVFFADGEEWYKHRSIISKRMLRPREVASYSEDMNQIISDFIDHIRQVREPAGTSREFEIKELDNAIFKWAFENVASLVFDKHFGALEEPMVDQRVQKFIFSVQEFFDTFINVSLLPMSLYQYYETKTYKRFIDAVTSMYFFVECFLEETVQRMKLHEAGSQGEEEKTDRVKFLDYLLMSGQLEVDDLIASVIDLMFAGVDTTSNCVHWSLYLLGKNPDKLKTLENEIHSVLKPGEMATLETTKHTPFLKAVVKESLRLYPIVNHLSRKIPQDMILSGYHIPANTHVHLNLTKMGRNSNLFPDPEVFRPERWFGENSEQSKFASLPFGFGVRMCLGRRFAELEMHLLLARLVQEFRMEYPSGEDIPVKMRGTPIPKKNVPIKFYDR